MSEIILEIGNVPVSPDANKVTMYPKSDKRIYIKDENGVEVSFSPPATTDALNEGITNLYFTPKRAQDAVGAILTSTSQISLAYNGFLSTLSATLVAGGITDIEISAIANISLSKLASVTVNRVLVSNGLGKIDVSTITSTELNALSGISGSVQTQLNAKEPTITAGTSLQYYRGDKTFQTLNAAAIPDFSTAAQSAVYPVAAANTTGFATIATSGSFVDLTNSPISSSGQMSTSLETAVVSLTDAPTIAIDASLGNTFTVTLGGNRTLGTPTNPVSGQKIIVRVTQDGVGGRQLSYSSGWALGIDFVALPLSTSPGVTDYIGAIYNTLTSKWDVVSIMRGY